MRELLDEAVQKEKELSYAEPPLYSRPVLESLAHALIRAGKFADARDAFQQELIDRPHSGFALYDSLFDDAGSPNVDLPDCNSMSAFPVSSITVMRLDNAGGIE